MASKYRRLVSQGMIENGLVIRLATRGSIAAPDGDTTIFDVIRKIRYTADQVAEHNQSTGLRPPTGIEVIDLGDAENQDIRAAIDALIRTKKARRILNGSRRIVRIVAGPALARRR